MPVAGQVVGEGVKLVRLLGRGTHSAVYFAVSREGRACAAKIFPAHLSAFAEREYLHGAGLGHPRLAPVLLRTHLDDLPVLIVQYAKGETLFQRYVQLPALQWERQAFLLTLSHVLDALAFMHARGLVHRDIKPDNIIAEADGSAKLVDYDLSGPQFEPLAVPTRMGTPGFLSPEAARGEPLGPESDLYGVGVLLGWGMFGQLPEEGEALPVSQDLLTPLWQLLTCAERQKRPADAAWVKEQLLRALQTPANQ